MLKCERDKNSQSQTDADNSENSHERFTETKSQIGCNSQKRKSKELLCQTDDICT